MKPIRTAAVTLGALLLALGLAASAETGAASTTTRSTCAPPTTDDSGLKWLWQPV